METTGEICCAVVLPPPPPPLFENAGVTIASVLGSGVVVMLGGGLGVTSGVVAWDGGVWDGVCGEFKKKEKKRSAC